MTSRLHHKLGGEWVPGDGEKRYHCRLRVERPQRITEVTCLGESYGWRHYPPCPDLAACLEIPPPPEQNAESRRRKRGRPEPVEKFLPGRELLKY